MNRAEPPPHRILIVVTPHFNLSATTSFLDPFRAANYLEGRTLFGWEVASEGGGACLASNGMTLATAPLGPLLGARWDMAIVSASWTPEAYATQALRSALWRLARGGATLGALDTGAFILARAGLLDGRRATVHYEHMDAFGERYPDIALGEELMVLDGDRISCGGGAATSDFALHIIRGLHGDALANAAARYLLHPPVRPVQAPQNPDAAEPLGPTAPSGVRRAIALMERHLETPLPIAALCARIGLSQRQLDRLFKTYVRKTPMAYYRDIRLDRARGLVTQTEMPMAQVALACGFASQVHFSRAYRLRFGLPPSRDRIEGRVPFEFRAWPMHSTRS
ncbi:GlxA family transcriptional regulator [Roseovarius spongiae]|uniref:GlxA family transcriptional regulator n=1 Tax=Roseovarius spongiae TaxID=2320272 RepID=A0A3A8B4Y6_9RHOB|nr:GlxA family transcriptional regulator [Roseovarius spongiae]RKF16991.1 GlxA family transcriptional regulator [Roseovarius spongiae]